MADQPFCKYKYVAYDIYYTYFFYLLNWYRYLSVDSSIYGSQQRARDIAEQRERTSTYSLVEPRSKDIYDTYGADGLRGTSSGILSRTLRVKTTGRDGVETQNVKIPVSSVIHPPYVYVYL